jgi:hypothetical protein
VDNFPLPPERQKDMQQKPGRTSLDTYILLAVLAVLLLTSIVQLVSHLNGDSGLLSLVTGFFIVASLCCIAIAAWRAAVTRRPHAASRSVAMSAVLGSFLSGLFTVVFADDISLTSPFIVIGILLAIIALCIIGLLLILGEEETTEEMELPRRRLPAQSDSYRSESGSRQEQDISVEPAQLSSQRYREAGLVKAQSVNSTPQGRKPANSPSQQIPITTQQSPDVLNIMPTEASGLSSLFEKDELYSIPRETRARLFILSKSNDLLENCEDACDISHDDTRFALCDGVSTSKFARPWARLLAEEWVAQPLATTDEQALGAWLKTPRERWIDWINNTWFLKINDRNRNMGRLEFTRDEVETFIKQGAAATFLGLQIDKASSTWSVTAIGDTCLFHFWHNDTGAWKYQSFPLKRSIDFTDAPAYITTRPQSEALIASHLESEVREYKAGDLLVLATDALAMWLLTELEDQQAENVIKLFATLESGNDKIFAMFVNGERDKKRLKDDDTTLILIHL